MSAILKSIDDPRSPLDRTRRMDLVKYAKAHGIEGISDQVPAILIRKKFRALGINRIPVAFQTLGQPPKASAVVPPSPALTQGSGAEIDADADLERQFSQQPVRKTLAQMSINELRAEAKRLGIKLTRKDGMVSMKAKIEAHGQNAS